MRTIVAQERLDGDDMGIDQHSIGSYLVSDDLPDGDGIHRHGGDVSPIAAPVCPAIENIVLGGCLGIKVPKNKFAADLNNKLASTAGFLSASDHAAIRAFGSPIIENSSIPMRFFRKVKPLSIDLVCSVIHKDIRNVLKYGSFVIGLSFRRVCTTRTNVAEVLPIQFMEEAESRRDTGTLKSG